MRVTPFGEDGWLVAADDPIALAAAIDATDLADVVPGADCVLLRGNPQVVARVIADLPEELATPVLTSVVTLQVTWDGPDLAEVARMAGMSNTALVEVMRSTTFKVAFCGFSPGFGYMTGLPRPLHVPRRARPRSSVPAGSVAIAAGYCAVYPTESPGGWHLLGTSTTALFDPCCDPPALLGPGTIVRFA
jgi:KipI family sensor histidine kinase inhibitor